PVVTTSPSVRRLFFRIKPPTATSPLAIRRSTKTRRAALTSPSAPSALFKYGRRQRCHRQLGSEEHHYRSREHGCGFQCYVRKPDRQQQLRFWRTGAQH